MATKSARRFVVQDRDREIFRFVGEHETATFTQVRQKFWAGSVTDKTAHDRLDKLRKEGYLDATRLHRLVPTGARRPAIPSPAKRCAN